MAGLSVPPLSLKQIRKRCELIRTIFDIPLNEPVDIVKVFEYILTQIGVEFEVVPKHEMGRSMEKQFQAKTEFVLERMYMNELAMVMVEID